MAVIAELIEAGLRLKGAGNLRAAIEHFKQLHATYPGHARIMFELAAAWRAFGVPEQALPLYRESLAMPKNQGLPAKDMPRLYTQLGATLLELGALGEAMAVIEAGLQRHPSYRSLRAWRVFAFVEAGSPQVALLDALELMLESLAPSRWDIFEDDIKAMVKAMRANQPARETDREEAEPETVEEETPAEPAEDSAHAEAPQETNEDAGAPKRDEIAVSLEAPDTPAVDVEVNLVAPAKKKKTASRKKRARPQLGKKAVRIDIAGEADAPPPPADDDSDASASGTVKIPIDLD